MGHSHTAHRVVTEDSDPDLDRKTFRITLVAIVLFILGTKLLTIALGAWTTPQPPETIVTTSLGSTVIK
jgi:hypothetical protein